MMSQPSQQAITIYILPNISQNKSNHTMKFFLAIEDNKRNNLSTKIMQKMRQ